MNRIYFEIFVLIVTAVPPLPSVTAQRPDRTELELALRPLQSRMMTLQKEGRVPADEWADAQIFLKAAVWAIDLEPELDAQKTAMVQQAIRRASQRIEALESGSRPWSTRRGRLIRGFVSSVDGSTQPFGLVVPAMYDPRQPIRLDVVLHGSHGGRASGIGDLLYIRQFDQGDETETGPSVNYIEVHPMGRLGENAYRFEGETDIDEAIEAVCRNYSIDRTRVVLRGSSLGGVGTWQVGLKRPDRFVALGPTAGPVDTVEFANSPWPHFIRLDPLTSWQKKMLHLVDAIDYTANARMVPVVAAMGDQDHYFSSHLLIQKAFETEGIPFVAVVDIGGGHGVKASVLEEQLRLIGQHAARGLDATPEQIRFVTWTLRYSRCHWVEILGLAEHYQRAELDARITTDSSIVVAEPQNITRFCLRPPALSGRVPITRVILGGTTIILPPRTTIETTGIVLERAAGHWRYQGTRAEVVLSGKRPGLQGPIDDAFATRFLCVRGTGTPWNPVVNAWAEANLQRFEQEWRRHYRGDLPIKNDTEVTADDLHRCNLILFGDPGSNRWIGEIAPMLPLRWNAEECQLGNQNYSAADHGLQLISPNPLPAATGRYVVFNSGHTWHERELRFSYMVFPRRGDWAVIKVNEPNPELDVGTVAETLVTSGFFDETWNVIDSQVGD